MSRIDLRGVIVPADYDQDFFKPYIDKGMITPESVFRQNVKSASKDEPLEVYVNSPGGSVFSAYEMVNAVREWKSENKKPCKITLGAMAASAAAFFAAEAGSSVSAHKNSKMMFHGATAEVWGGKQAMEDEAKLLGQINAGIQNTLINKYSMNPDTVAEWFKEGRQGWLDAADMKKAGIAQEIIEDDADELVFDDAAIAAMDSQGLKIAAYAATKQEKTDGSDKPAGNGAPSAEPADANGACTKDVAPVAEPETSESAYQRGLTESQTKHAEALTAAAEFLKAEKERLAVEHGAAVAELNAKISKLESLQSKTQGERDSSRSQVEKLSVSLKETSDKLSRFISGGLSFSPAVETWEDAMKDCGMDYAKAAKKYKSILDEYLRQHNNKGK